MKKFLKLDFSCPDKHWWFSQNKLNLTYFWENHQCLSGREKSNFGIFFHENLHACLVFMYKNKNKKKIGKFPILKKITFFSYQLKKYLSLNGQEKSNFQKFSTKFCISLEDVKNYLNINVYEKNLKIGFFLAKKRRPKTYIFHFSSLKKALF